MDLSVPLLDHLSEQLSADGPPIAIDEAIPVGGGSINDAYRLVTKAGNHFLKTNSADRYPNMFEAEADGLTRLRAAMAIRVPELIAHGSFADLSFLLLEFVPKGPKDDEFWRAFGAQLAALHRTSAVQFGLDRPNYIGSLVQVNTQENDWHSFLVQHRLEPMVKMGRDNGKLTAPIALRCERLYGRIGGLFPQESPSLLHGDLWQGNFLCTEDGVPVLVDPAVYFGHREMDLAMTRLFGGFDSAFHIAYHEAWPLENGWQERVELCQLYPLLVHANLFGGSYVQQVDAVLKRFV